MTYSEELDISRLDDEKYVVIEQKEVSNLIRTHPAISHCAMVVSRQQKLPPVGKGLNTKQLVDTTFWLKHFI